MNRRFLWRFSLLSIVSFLFIIVFSLAEYWSVVGAYFVVYAFCSYFLYSRYIKKVIPCSLAPPSSNDIYFPRSNIPRPLYEDIRKYPEYFDEKKKKQEQQKKNT